MAGCLRHHLGLSRKLILLLRDCHHYEVARNPNLRLGRDWSFNHCAQVCFIKHCLVFFTDDRLVREPRWSLSPHRHTTGLLAEHVRRYRPHLISLDGVRVRDDALPHLVFCRLDSVRGDIVYQKGPDNVFDLLIVVGPHFFNKFFVFGLGSDSPHGHFRPTLLLAWYLNRVLSLLLRVHN